MPEAIDTSTTVQGGPYPLSSLSSGDKVALFYHRKEDLDDTLVALVRTGLRQHQMCVLISAEKDLGIKDRLRERGLDTEGDPAIVLLPLDFMMVKDMSDEMMRRSMKELVDKAKGIGLNGVMVIINITEGFSTLFRSKLSIQDMEALREEAGVALVSLYDLTSLPPSILLRALAYYPLIIMEGMLCRNFYHQPSFEAGSADRHRDIYQHLSQIREEHIQRLMDREERSRLLELNRQLEQEMMHRRMVEFALLQAENNMRTMLDAMPESIFMVDRGLRVFNGNQTFLSFLRDKGYDTSFEGKTIEELFPDAPPENWVLFEEVFLFGITTVTEESFQKDDDQVEMEVRRVPVFKGETVDRIVVMFQHRPVEGHAVPVPPEQVERLKAEVLAPLGPRRVAMERCPHMVLVHELDGRLHAFNDAACRGLGYTREELTALGSTVPLFKPFADMVRIRRRYARDGNIALYANLRRKDGSRLETMCHQFVMGRGPGHRIIMVLEPM
jgi:PAS domain S-box-containing protein